MMPHITRVIRFVVGSICFGAAAACNDMSADLPVGSIDPKHYATPEAAMRLAGGARYEFQLALLEYMLDAGRISDEFFDPDSANRLPGIYGTVDASGTVNNSATSVVVLDQRHLPDESLGRTDLSRHISAVASYPALQRVRAAAMLARRAVETYVPEPQLVLRGELLAYEALAELMLADLYCSGVPLSTVDFQGDWTYQPGSTTAQVYGHAIALLDSALVLAANDPAILSMVRVARGRALVALGRYDDAAGVVRDVPTGFRFTLRLVRANSQTSGNPDGFSWSSTIQRRSSIADRKGANGLPFGTITDPRVQRTTVSGRQVVAERTHLQVTSHIEARLIEAEADLQAGGSQWLAILNTLRTTSTTCTVKTTPSCAATAPAGTGGVAGLPLLTDPALDPLPAGKTAFDVRIDLVFRERALWLFATGNRQGDLRRLIRHYNRSVETVYPVGSSRGGFESYDTYVDVPIPEGERFNPHFTGCTGRGE